MSIYQSEKVVTQHIGQGNLNIFTLGYESDKPREEAFVELLIEVLPEFSFGLQNEGIEQTKIIERVREAAKSIYGSRTTNGGEMGEAILHLFLRDYFQTIPLISGIYFKDSDEQQVHGFDALHVTESDKKIWLGESKFYKDKNDGIRELAQSVVEHFEQSYLRRQFALISKKLPANIPEREHWISLLNSKTSLDEVFKSVAVPCLCTYDCSIYGDYKEASEVFLQTIVQECEKLKVSFDGKITSPSSDIDIYLLLFPIPSKETFLKLFTERVGAMTKI